MANHRPDINWAASLVRAPMGSHYPITRSDVYIEGIAALAPPKKQNRVKPVKPAYNIYIYIKLIIIIHIYTYLAHETLVAQLRLRCINSHEHYVHWYVLPSTKPY